jgi:predicted SAM-dependent methyltransferase
MSALKKFIKKLIFYNSLLRIKNYFLKLILKIKIIIRNENDFNIIIGAGDTKYNGWISTDINTLDITSFNSWQFLFKINSLDNILAEHIFEHLTFEEAVIACNNCNKFLKKGGNLRIAVPDGYFPNKNYIESVKPGGLGPGAKDHKQLYNFKSIQKIFNSKIFDYELIEYFDQNGKFNNNMLDINKGYIIRSRFNDERNTINKINYTSLIIDLIKK